MSVDHVLFVDPSDGNRYHAAMKLTDEQNWMIINTLPEVSSASLARSFDMLEITVAHARIRLQRRGWTCPVAYVTCRECGELLTNDQAGHPQRRYHPSCRVIESQRIEHRRNERRWATMADASRTQTMERAREYTIEAQRTSQLRANQHGATWTADEDALLIEQQHVNILSLCQQLGRTYWAVDSRRRRLRQRGLLD